MVDDTLRLHIDWSSETRVEIWAATKITKVIVNDNEVAVTKTNYGSMVVVLSAAPVTVRTIENALPKLTNWKVADGLPEVAADYDDSRWTSKFFIR